MRRTGSFFSIPGLFFTALLLAGLGVSAWLHGGKAFSPGALSSQAPAGVALGGFSSHAEFQDRCVLCHDPLRSTQDTLCLACHTDIAAQIQSGLGTHAAIDPVNPCYRCHSDHQGRDFNLLNPGLALFDHTQTRFELTWHQLGYDQAPLECAACHSKTDFSLDLAQCVNCHAGHDPAFMQQHQADFGPNCLDCHDGRQRLAEFDHAQTDFPLQGKHTGLTCAACHRSAAGGAAQTVAERFKTAPLECNGCHAEPPAHQGMFGTDCQECHTADAWQPAIWKGQPFEHATNAGFSLALHARDYAGRSLTCAGCHSGPVEQDVTPACVACHGQGTPERVEFIRQHQEQFGTACLDCHDGVDRMSNFDHNRFFTLDGAHLELECQKCHAGQSFKGTPSACVACHAEPPIHAGIFGTTCQDCHSTQAWSPAQLRNHSFPLDHGGQGLVACQTCHPNNYVEYTCYGCHEHDPARTQAEHSEENISLNELQDCVRCHPGGRKEGGSDD